MTRAVFCIVLQLHCFAMCSGLEPARSLDVAAAEKYVAMMVEVEPRSIMQSYAIHFREAGSPTHLSHPSLSISPFSLLPHLRSKGIGVAETHGRHWLPGGQSWRAQPWHGPTRDIKSSIKEIQRYSKIFKGKCPAWSSVYSQGII